MKGYFQTLASSILLVLIFLLPAISHAQQLSYEQGQIIIQLKEGVKGEDWVKRLPRIEGTSVGLSVDKLISNAANIYLLAFDYTQVHDDVIIRWINRRPEVLNAQFNHFVEMRATPNDEQFSSQWQYLNEGQSGGTPGADIDADLAWDVTTGGVTLTGDTIVVAVLDDGIDLDHEDIQKNLWVNRAEIPDNDIDDDNNGYVDDYQGWSIITDDDNIAGGNHGTPVAGIVGADGNNEIGVTGVSWNVKVMVIKNNFNTNEAQVLEAYSYALEQRMNYNQSGGTKGAFVVATNASWGVDQGDPEDAPIWCDFYNTLGEAGILNCGATANADFNIDEEGDLPTACPSDYLISVTNMNHNDMKVNQAGYGLETIDLGAFGANTFTLANNNGYGGFGGTSGATPHVAGTIGLLYSLQCPSLMGIVQADPGAAALLIKNAILDGTDPNESLDSITVTGGRLNIMGSINQILPNCDGCIPAISVHTSDITDEMAQLNWLINDSLLSVDVRWRAVGNADWTLIEDAQSPYVFNDLLACQDYEYQIQSNCQSDTLFFANSIVFRTDGCCLAPDNFVIASETDEITSFTWDAVLAAQAYEFSYRVVGAMDWMNTAVTETSFTLDIEACENYEYRLRTICLTDTTDWTPVESFLTTGCGPCLDLEYCVPESMNNSEEHIARVEIEGLLDNISTEAPGGYIDYGPEVPFIELEQGGQYFIRLTPGFPGASYNEAWRLWLDADHDGSFANAVQNNEIVFSAQSSQAAAEGIMQIPADADLGVTRLRVLMKFNTANSPCYQDVEFGEVEDYCVNIVPTTACDSPSDLSLETVDTTSATIAWTAIGPAVSYEADYRLASETDWTEIEVNDASSELENLLPCSDYIFRIKTICDQTEAVGSSTFEFTTNCVTDVDDISNNLQAWSILPNPFEDQLSLQWSVSTLGNDMSVKVYDAFGKEVSKTTQWLAGEPKLVLNLNHLPAGVYTLSLLHNGRLWSAKRVVKM